MHRFINYLSVVALLGGLLFMPGFVSEGMAAGKGGISPADMERINKARDIYHENCAVCHGYDGIPILPGAPNFMEGERLDQQDNTLLKTMQEGKADMPPWKEVLSTAEQLDVLSYVRGIAGDQVFQDKCNSCHGKSVPPLSESIPQSRKKLDNYRGPLDLCRGCDVETTMDQKEIIDVIKFLRTLPKGSLK